MINIKIYLARLFLALSILSVLLTVVLPAGKLAIGQIIIRAYSGLYSVIALGICLSIYSFLAKHIKEDVWVNRLKLLLSFSFLTSLISNLLFLN